MMKNDKKWNIPSWMVGVCGGIICFMLGALYGQFGDILQKAIMICLECIGIGQVILYEEKEVWEDTFMGADCIYNYHQWISLRFSEWKNI